MAQKRLLTMMMVLCLVLALAACGGGETEVDIGTWSVAVEGVEGVTAFTSDDAKALEFVTAEMTITNKNGESTTTEFTGVTLKSLLASIGVTEVTGVTVESSDGFGTEYNSELAMADDTLLAWHKDGEVFEGEPPLRMCPGQGTGNQYVKNAAKIIVN